MTAPQLPRDPDDTRARRLSAENDVADAVARTVWGSERDGRAERLLEANPGLADLGPVLPVGVELAVPEAPAPSGRRTLRLWS